MTRAPRRQPLLEQSVISADDHRHYRSAARDWLAFAATPTFATMAVASSFAGDPMTMLCSPAMGMLSTGGMTMMYLLMAVFHAGPWLQWLGRLRQAHRHA